MSSRQDGRVRRRAGALLALVALVACTSDPSPDPGPTPAVEETPEPAPSGVQVAVVLPAPGDPTAATFLEPATELARLAEGRVGDVAGVRPVTPDDPGFVPDVAALLAESGADLVCVLAADGSRTVLDLADRFPATRFCALGTARDGTPDNVDLVDVDHEGLGLVLGAAASTLGPPVGIVRGDDRGDRARRRSGARAALADEDVVLDAVVADAAQTAEVLAVPDEDAPQVLVVDVADAGVGTVAGASVPRWIGPRGLAVDDSAGPAAVRWSVRADTIVGVAVDVLLGERDRDPPFLLGFGDEVFVLSLGDDLDERTRAVIETTTSQLAAGTRDALGTG